MINVGVCYFAMQSKHFKCKDSQGVFAGISKPALAILWSSFGLKNNCLAKWMQRYPEGTLLIHMSNEVARRKVMYKGELLRRHNVNKYNEALENKKPRVLKAVRKRIRQIRSFVEQHKIEHRVILSLGLEDNFTRDAVRVLLKIAREEWPYEISRNPVRKDETYIFGRNELDLIELHGGTNVQFQRPKRAIYSNDGLGIRFNGPAPVSPEISTSDLLGAVKRHREKGTLCFVWWPEVQGLSGNSRWAPKPRKRRIKHSDSHNSIINSILKGSK